MLLVGAMVHVSVEGPKSNSGTYSRGGRSVQAERARS